MSTLVPKFGQPRVPIRVNPRATEGAVFGEDLFIRENGVLRLLTLADLGGSTDEQATLEDIAAAVGVLPLVRSLDGYTGDVILWEVVEVPGILTAIAQEDRDKLQRFTNAAAKTLLVEAEADVPILQDSRFHIRNAGAGLLTISPEPGVTINAETLVLPENATATLIRVAEDLWDLVLYGVADIAAADVSYDNATSGLAATEVQAAIDELASGQGPDPVTALVNSSGTVTIDCSLGKSFTLALTANVTTVTLTNLNGAGFATEIEVQFTQDVTGGRTVALPASFKALGGSDTAVAAAANAVTVLSAKTFDNGTTWRYAMQESA